MNYHLKKRINLLQTPPIPRKRIISNLILSLVFTCFLSPCFSQGHPATDDEFAGPFSSWINVKTQYGAVGDGITDETAALQAAFNAIGNLNSTASVVYLPAGTYRITGTLTMNSKMDIAIIGADPATTKIIWAGAAGGTMMQIDGTAYSRFNRINWDGNSIAGIAIDQSWNGSTGYFDTGNEFADNIFGNVGIGIRGGYLGHGFAETAIMRCTFSYNTVAGISLGNFNALDAWVWHSIFDHCKVGITNDNTTSSAGNFKVYNSIFRNSTTSDIVIGNTGEFSFRDNTSTNSQMFLKASLKNYPANITLQSNIIIDPIASTAIDIRDQGPVVLIDNIIRSRSGATSPVIFHATSTSSELFSMGNTFTVANAIYTNGRSIVYDNAVVSAGSLNGLAEQSLPGPQPNLNRQVFEVPPGSDAAAIQLIINQAALLAGTRPIVHFPHGKFNITSTLIIPAGADMQLVGDGDGANLCTWLWWTGSTSGPVIKIEGPSKVTLRDFSIYGNNIATNILMENVDQTGARVFMHQVEVHYNQSNLFVNGLDKAHVLAYNSRFSASSVKSINVVGGPLAAAGSSRTIIYGGLAWENNLSHEVSNGANLLVRDVWYESLHDGPYLNLSGSGTFTLDGSHVTSPRASLIPQMSLSGFTGKATVLNSYMQDTVAINGNGSGTQFLGLGVVFSDNTSVILPGSTSYINNTASPAGDVRSFNSRSYNNPDLAIPRSGSFAVNDTGQPDSLFIATMINSARNVHAQVLNSLPNGVSDIRLYRVWSYYGAQGMEIKAAASLPPDYFRTVAAGNWNNTSTWESSADNITWYAATLTPDYIANTITIGHNVNVTANITIDQATINSGDTLFVDPNIVLTVNDGTGPDITINNGGNITLKSTASGSAIIGNSSGTVSGDVTVERFISSAYARSAWRLLTAPLRSATGINGTVFSNWQNAGINTPGIGTNVTGPAYNGSNGIDASSPAASMKWFDGTNLQPLTTTNTPATTPLFTTATSAANNSFFIFIRGDRNMTSGTSGTTTLSATGNLQTGDQTFTTNTVANGYTLIGNPYPSPVDLDLYRQNNSTSNIKSTYYYWDPYLSGTYGYGGYVTVSYDGTGSSYTIVPAGADHTRFLQGGQAMFVQTNNAASGTTAVIFKETQKSTNNINTIFRTPSGQIESLEINLNIVSSGTPVLADGIIAKFDNSYSEDVDNHDANKFYNTGESIAFIRNHTSLSVERRPEVKTGEILYLNLANLKADRNYEFEFTPEFNAPSLNAYLQDNYLKTTTPIGMNATSTISFTVNSDVASAGGNRFSIVFAKPGVVQLNKQGISVFPNPVTNGIINLQINNAPKGIYTVRLLNGQGQVVIKKKIDHKLGVTDILHVNKEMKGAYYVEVIKADNSAKYSEKILLK